MDGSYGPASEKVNQFIEQLKLEIDVPIKTWDERLSSVQANRVLLMANVSRKKRKGKVDKMAAAIILQSYLDSVQM
jgi:putative Holliday junction resolvase